MLFVHISFSAPWKISWPHEVPFPQKFIFFVGVHIWTPWDQHIRVTYDVQEINLILFVLLSVPKECVQVKK